MYTKRIQLINYGPVEKLDIEFPFEGETPNRLRKKGVSVKLPCTLSPELDEIRLKRVFKSRTLPFSW